ncbi:MAG: tRNA pseudouridine(38-40) synthase TruA [Treponema sp.]|nr:tRNA pseudouridine(38-40) synthase TruA [Treponema sp.]
MSTSPLRNIKILIAYDGTDFAGWQNQKGERTVQAQIEEALFTIHKTDISLTGAGRTDAGVHAAGQCANFYTPIQSMEPHRFVRALNRLLPPDISLRGAWEVPLEFHSRFHAVNRTYRYYLIYDREALPWETRYALRLHHRANLGRLNEYTRLFRGEMDCSTFAAAGDTSLSKHRYISSASFFIEGDKLVFEISANAFLRRMVRSILGTLLDFDEKALAPEYLQEVISSGDRSLAGPTAPAQGLFLWKVDYQEPASTSGPSLMKGAPFITMNPKE